MSLTFLQMQHLLNEIKPLVEGAQVLSVTAADDSSFILKFKQKDSFYYLFLSLKERFFRFHLIDGSSKPADAKVNPFFQKLSKFLVGEVLLDLSLLNEDRILALTFKKGQKIYRLVAEFLPRRANCYLMDALRQIHASLHVVGYRIYDLPKEAIPRNDSEAHMNRPINLFDSKVVAKLYSEIESKHAFSSLKLEIETDLKKQFQRAARRVLQRKERLKECLGWESVQHDGALLQSNLYRIKQGVKEVIIADWDQNQSEKKIQLDPLTPPHFQVAFFFKKAKKLKAGIPYAEKQLEIAEDDFKKIEQLQKKLELVKTLDDLKDFSFPKQVKLKFLEKAPALKVKKAPAKPYHVFKSISGREIWVGKSAKDNDKLTFQCARGLDWWLHARDFPGSHVVIPVKSQEGLDEATLSDAGELALRYSKAKGQNVGEVSLTHVKGVVSVKGCPGKVMLSKYKTVSLKLDDERWDRLRGSKVTLPLL